MSIAASFPAAHARTQPQTTPRTHPRVRPRSTSAKAPVRLTRRGRIVAVSASVLFLLAVLVFSGSMNAIASNSTSADQAARSIVVEPGQSLWQIARMIAPGEDPRAVALEIRELNGLVDSTVTAGMSLALPTI